MTRCVDYDKCPFLKKYESEFEKSKALKEKVMMYCDGDLQDKCIREKIAKTLGGTEYVPVNMMPEGTPVSGTSMNEWSAEVLSLVEKFN